MRERSVYLLGLNVENSLVAIRSFAARLLSQVAHGSALVEQPQLAVLALGIPRVAVDASIEHCPVEVSYQAADVAGGVWLSRGTGVLQAVDVLLEVVIPEGVVAFIHGIDLTRFWTLDVVVREDEFSVERVQSEAVDSITD